MERIAVRLVETAAILTIALKVFVGYPIFLGSLTQYLGHLVGPFAMFVASLVITTATFTFVCGCLGCLAVAHRRCYGTWPWL